MQEAVIDSRQVWCPTGIRLEAGRRYRLSARGSWNDASIVTDAAGYESTNLFQGITERLRRVPGARWFALVGAIDRRRETQFVIGRSRVLETMHAGELTCFANDLHGFYFNNSGSIVLTVDEEAIAPTRT
jgi:hypothetical protein